MTNPKIDSEGNKCWFNNDVELHREDGPAIEYADGSTYWYVNGKIHRLDGPAGEYADGTCDYWINGQQLTEDKWNVHSFRIEYVIQENLKSILHE